MTLARRSLWALLVVCGLGLAYVATAASDGGTTTTTSASTTTTEATTTPVTTPPPPPATTAVTTTTATVALEPTIRPIASQLDRGCLVVGSVALRLPGHALPLVFGHVAHAPWAKQPTQLGFQYPADGAVIYASSASITAPQCGSGMAAVGVSSIKGLSLFGGAVTVDTVTLRINSGDTGSSVAVKGLRIGGTPLATPPAGQKLPVGNWGYLEVFRNNRVRVRRSQRLRVSGLVLHLLVRRANVPAGSEIQITFADLAVATPPPPVTTTATTTVVRPTPPVEAKLATAPRTKKIRAGRRSKKLARPKRPTGEPLTVTPPLGRQSFVFPVAGPASFGDTYGGLRTDVPGGWHHGDDIFATLGTPVIAVATGTLNRVGWERIGGWRLWVRDQSGDEFYYAHLSGYAPAALHSKQVKMGEIIGFVGNSGDAYPATPPHLHFEVHPRSLLHLQYNGAVDPTSYLESWTRVERLRAPHPALPGIASLPSAQVKQEAKVIFRELLSDRGLLKNTRRTKPTPAPIISRPAVLSRHEPATKLAASTPIASQPAGSFDAMPLALVVLAGIGVVGAGVITRLRKPRSAAAALLKELDALDDLDW